MFFDKLKKLLEGGVAQVNPFDNGKTFSTVMQNRQPAPPQQQKPNIIQDMARTAQQGVQNQVRSFNNITRPVTGVSVSEITKQIPQAWGQVGKGAYGIGENVVKSTYDVGNKAVQTLDAPLKSIQIRNDISTGKITRNEGNRRMDNEFNQGFMSRDVAEGRAGVGEFGRQFTNAGLTIAPYVAPGLKGTSAAGRAAMPFKQALKPILQEGLGYSGLEVVRQAANKEEVTPSSVLNAGLTNVLGEFGAQGLAKVGANAVSEPLTRKGRELLERTAQAGQQFADNMPARTQGGFVKLPGKQDPLEALKAEARKYKSAEEFVASKGEPVFHGTKSDFTEFDNAKMGSQTDSGMYGKGFYFTPNTKSAKHYAGAKGKVKEVYLDMKNPYVINSAKDIPDIKVDGYNTNEYSEKFTKYLKDKGYDGVIDNLGVADNQRVVFDASQIKTKQQLTDLYNQATKPGLLQKLKDGMPERTQGGYIKLPDGSLSKDAKGRFVRVQDQGKVDYHPDDQKMMYDFVQYVRSGEQKKSPNPDFEATVADMMQSYNTQIDPRSISKFADDVQYALENNNLKPLGEADLNPPVKEPGPLLSPRGIDEETGMGRKLFNQSDFRQPQLDDKSITNLAKTSKTVEQFLDDMRGRSGKTPEELTQIFQNTQKKGGFGDFLGGLLDKKRGGYARLPGWSDIPDNIKMPKNEGDKAIRSMIDEAADALSDFKKQNGGVTRVMGEDGVQLRESMNPKWYQEFYAANGRAPSKGEIREIAYKMLESGDRELEGIGIDTALYQATKEMATQVPKAPAPEAANALQPAPEVNTKQSGFARSVSKSDEVSPELQAQVKQAAPEYTPVTNQAQIDTSEALIKNKGYKDAAVEINERLNVKEGTIDNQTTSDAIAAIKALDAKGGPANLQLATDITEKLASHLTKAGQTVQAASILNNRTPQGMLYAARKTLKKAGVEVTPEIQASLDAAVKKVKATTGEEKQYAIAELTKTVNELIPSSFKDKAVTLWKAGLLTGIKTQTGNTLSGGASFAMKKASDPLAAGIDKLISLGTGKRTKTLTFKGVGSGAGEGMVKGWDSLKTGIDERNIEANKFDLKQVNFGKGPLGRAADKYTKTVFGIMGAADRPLYYATLRNNLQDIAKAEAINNGLKGGKRAAFIADFIKNPPTKQFQTATNAAEKAIFGNDTVLSKAAASLRQSTEGSPVAGAVVDVILPFTKVPSAVVSRIIDYSPVGAVKTAVLAIRNAKKTGVLDQRALSEGLAEAGVGTGVIAIGMALRDSGLMTGSYPEDKKERELWKLEGKQENSVKVGGTWLSLNYTSPLGQLLGVGGKIADSKKGGASTPEALAVGAAGGASTVLDQSFLQGVQGALDTVSNPVEEVPKFLNRQAGSLIPTLVGDTAKATDPLQRESDNPLEAILARVPGASQKLNPKRDAFGDPLPRQSNPVSTMVDPFRPSDIRPGTPLNTELRRLQDAGEGIVPLRDSSYLGNDKKLSKSELNQIGSEVGPKVKASWEKVIADPRYAKLSDADKNTTLRKAMTDINAAYKVMDSGSEEAYKNLTTDQKRVYSGKDSSAFKDEPATAKERYESKLTTYNEDKEAGKITEIEDIKRKRELKGLEVRKDYSEDAIDLHAMSKKDVYNYISQSQNGKKLAEELLKLDDALTAAGVQDKNKFRDKYGNPTLQPKEKGSAKGKKAKMPTDYAKTRKAISSKIRSKSTQVTYKGTSKGSGVAIRKTLKKAKI